jgi:hypothetical protein
MQLDLTDEEASALQKLLADAIEYDRYPLSPRVQALRRTLAKLEPIAPPPPPAGPPTQDARRGARRSRHSRSWLDLKRSPPHPWH